MTATIIDIPLTAQGEIRPFVQGPVRGLGSQDFAAKGPGAYRTNCIVEGDAVMSREPILQGPVPTTTFTNGLGMTSLPDVTRRIGALGVGCIYSVGLDSASHEQLWVSETNTFSDLGVTIDIPLSYYTFTGSAPGSSIGVCATAFGPGGFARAFSFQPAGVGTTYTITALTSYPPGSVPGIAWLDGTYYVYDFVSAGLRGSGLNDPTTWSSLNTIIPYADPEGGMPTRVFRHWDFVVSMKNFSGQAFYDAGIPAGSPLGPVGDTPIPWGTSFPYTLVEFNHNHVWLGSNKAGEWAIVMMANLQCKRLSTPDLERLLRRLCGSTFAQWNNYNHQEITGYLTTIHNHPHYVLSVQYTYSSTTVPVTIAIDMVTGQWGWMDSGNQGMNFQFSAYDPVYDKILYQPYVGQLWGLQSGVTNGIYADTIYDGNPKPIQMDIVTPKLDGGALLVKTANRLEIYGDSIEASTINVAWSDDDYQKWSPFQAMDIRNQRAVLTDMGEFRRRAFRFRIASDRPVRLTGAKLFVDIGTE